MQSMEHLYQVVSDRREHPQEKSYTCYLFEQGLDKICKKIGEEFAEVIIAAKNGVQDETVGEVADLLYHLIVLLTSKGYRIEDLCRELQERHSATWKKH